MNNLLKVRHTTAKASASPAKISYVAIRAKTIPTAVRWSFLLFVGTFPLESADWTFMDRTLSLAKISGYLFFAFYVFYYSPLSRERSFPRPTRAVWWFLGYVVVYAANGFFLPEQFLGDFVRFFFTAVQLVVFFWIASDLLKDEKMQRATLLTFAIVSAILAAGIILRLPGFSVSMDSGRLEALGENPNWLGLLMALAAVMVIGVIANASVDHSIRRVVLAVLPFPFLIVLVQTGSRAAIVAFLIGCMLYLLPYWRSTRGLMAIIVASLGTLAVVYLSNINPDVLERWQRTYYEGHLASRDRIFPAAIEMVLERPVLGWRPIEFSHELGYRGGFGWRPSDAHNLFLYLLLEVGLVGAIPFFVGLGLCGWAAWRARGGNLGLLPLALFFTLLAGNMAGTGLKQKSLWLVLALASAAASISPGGQGQKSYRVLVGRPSSSLSLRKA